MELRRWEKFDGSPKCLRQPRRGRNNPVGYRVVDLSRHFHEPTARPADRREEAIARRRGARFANLYYNPFFIMKIAVDTRKMAEAALTAFDFGSDQDW